ncbi:hypothetical protein KCU72_g7502, partial [Aureobasidium melanogenum]
MKISLKPPASLPDQPSTDKLRHTLAQKGMAPTKPSVSQDATKLKDLQGEIKLMNRKLRLRVHKAYVSKEEYRSDTHASLAQKINGLVGERDDLKDRALEFEGEKLGLEKKQLELEGKRLELESEKVSLMKENDELQRQKQDLKAKNLDLKIAYYALRHDDKNGGDESPCSDHCCRPGEDSSDGYSSDEDGTEEDSSEEY